MNRSGKIHTLARMNVRQTSEVRKRSLRFKVFNMIDSQILCKKIFLQLLLDSVILQSVYKRPRQFGMD